jgi:hypothetical protein
MNAEHHVSTKWDLESVEGVATTISGSLVIFTSHLSANLGRVKTCRKG